MEYSLVRQQEIKFEKVVPDPNVGEDTKYLVRVARVPVEIYRKVRERDDDFLLQAFFERREEQEPKRLKIARFKKLRLDDQLNWTLDISVSLNKIISGAWIIKITGGTESEECCLSRLATICGGSKKFSVDMEMQIGNDPSVVVVRNLKLRLLKSINKIGFQTNYIGLVSLKSGWAVDDIVSGKLRMDLKLNDDAFDTLFKTTLQNPLSINRKLLSNSTLSDAVIRVKNGVDCEEVKCHKGFLSAHSPVFKAMFESSAQEGLTGTVEITDMTVQGVRALLSYLYCWELNEVSHSCSIALELLQSGNKYLIPRLVTSVQNLILAKDSEWFTAGVAAQLLQLAKNKREEGDETYKDIETKAIAILKSKSTLELKECIELQQLFQDPNIAMDLYIYLIRT